MYQNCHNNAIQRYSHKLITIRLDRKDNTHLCYFLFAVIFNISRNTFHSVGCIHKSRDKNDSKS